MPACWLNPSRTMPAQDVDGLMNKLNDYVGENGRYTAVVKSTKSSFRWTS